VTSFGLSNLSACTIYDADVYHVRNTLHSGDDSVVALYTTTAASGACAPLNFSITTCFQDGTDEYYNVAWMRMEYASGSTYEIGEASTSDPATATVISSGPSSTTATTIGPYTRGKPWLTYYFWVRHVLSNGTPSSWTPLSDNPVRPSIGC